MSTTTLRYDVEPTVVGQGGFGKVRKATDTILDRTVAIKQLDPFWKGALDDDKERFRREAKILAQLSHPNIPSIFDVIFGDDELQIICQYVHGKTLREILDDEDAISLSECKAWFDQVAAALEHAHEVGIIHRDIKPENMIVTEDRRHCYLVDFGLAISKEEIERITGSDELLGTPGYMSPEHQAGEDVDASDDLYVLGVCLYEALCGHQLTPGDYDSLASQNELIPPAIDQLVKKCIAKKPQRIDSARQFRALLKAALSGHRTLSEILTDGQLHEVADALRHMSPSQFVELKPGQRLLILQKCKDIIADPDRRLAAARIEFLTILPNLGIHLDAKSYKGIFEPALAVGLGELRDDGVTIRRGNNAVLKAITDAASAVAADNHHVVVDCIQRWIEGIQLDAQKTGFFHVLRSLVVPLMANPECNDEDATFLAGVLGSINDMQRRATDTVHESR